MPLGEERAVNPIALSDGTFLFTYYKYPLIQAFGGVLAEPKVTLHEGGIYRIRYESRDDAGRDRLEGARPIVTRDWKRSKWLNEYLIGLDELRLMGSLGGSGGPEAELYEILANPGFRDRLACYASKLPDEGGSRLIVLNWAGLPAEAGTAKVAPREDRSTVDSLSHQGSPAPPQPKLSMDSTQPVPIQPSLGQPVPSSPGDEAEIARPAETGSGPAPRVADEPATAVPPARRAGHDRSATPGRMQATMVRGRSSLSLFWKIAGVALFGALLLMAGWWLRGATTPPSGDVASAPTAPVGSTTGIGTPDDDTRVEDRSASERLNDETIDGVASGGGAAGDVVAERVTPEAEPAGNDDGTGSSVPPAHAGREKPQPVARKEPPVTQAKPSPSAAVAIETPLMAQGSAPAQSAPSRGTQIQERTTAPAPPVSDGDQVQPVPRPIDATAPPAAPVPPGEKIPELKITREQMSGSQRKYLARVIQFLEPPLKYEWTPKYTRPALFATLVTDGEPPKCRIDFKEPTSITFDLVIRGGRGTESRIENVELIYR